MSIQRPEFDADEQAVAGALKPRRGGCPPLDVLQAAGQDVLPPDVEARVTAHLADCPSCSGLLEDLARLPETTLLAEEQRRIATKFPLENKREASGGRLWMGIAAAVLLMVAGAVAWRSLSPKATEPQNAHGVAPASNAQQPVTTANLDIPLTPLAAPGGTALLTRGPGSHEPATEQLLPAFTAYNHADYAAAATKFSALAAGYPASEIVPLYLGVSQLYLGQNEQADANLMRVLTLGEKDTAPGNMDAARWYDAIAASRLHSSKATTLLQHLCDEKHSRYSPQSCKLVGSGT
ncbi:MAG TPA: hypothetical protein VGN16_13860 [Acidobacteriaceae bacterium]|jgi:hypothetical protein